MRYIKKKGTVICTSHDLGPKIAKIFGLKRKFHHDTEFVSKRTEWLKE